MSSVHFSRITACLGAIALIATLCTADRSGTERPVLVNGEALRIGLAFGGTLTWMPRDQLATTLDDAVTLGARWIRADLSWAEIQPESPIFYHGTLAVEPLDRGRKTKIVYTLFYDQAPLGTNEAKIANREQRTKRFMEALDSMKAMAEAP